MAARLWLHGPLSKEESEAMLSAAGLTDGRFLVRERQGNPGDYVLSIVYRTRPTHHLITFVDGKILVNNKKIGAKDCLKLEDLLDLLNTDTLPTGWPVRLGPFVPRKPTAAVPAIVAQAAPAPTPAPAAAPAPAPTPAPVPVVSIPSPAPAPVPAPAVPLVVVHDVGPSSPVAPRRAVPPPVEDEDAQSDSAALPWMHNEMTKPEADALLEQNASRGDGVYFMRPRGAANPNEYVLGVVYRGRPSHHLVKLQDNGTYTINSKGIGHPRPTTLNEVVTVLRTVQPDWPVALTHPVLRVGPYNPPTAARPASAAPSAPASVPPSPARPAALPTPVVEPPSPAVVPPSSLTSQSSMLVPADAVLSPVVPAPVEPEPEDTLPPTPAADHAEAERRAAQQRRMEELARQDALAREAEEQRAREKVTQDESDRDAADQARHAEEEKQAALLAAQRERQAELDRRAEQERRELLAAQQAAQAEREAAAAQEAEEQVRAERARVEGENKRRAQEEEARRVREAELQQQRAAEEAAQQREEARRAQEAKRAADEQARQAAEAQWQRDELQRRQREEQKQREDQRRKEQEEAMRRAAYAEAERQDRLAAVGALAVVPEETRARSVSGHSAAGISALSGRELSGQYRDKGATPDPSKPQVVPEQTRTDAVEGELRNVTIVRPNAAMSFGFAIASMWTIEKPINVISWVDPAGPASTALEVEDQIVGFNGESVENMKLDELKALVRRCGTEFKARIRRRPKRAPVANPNTTANGNVSPARPVVTRKCTGGVWCPCPACKRSALQEEERIMKSTMKMASRMDGKSRVSVVLGSRGGDQAEDPYYSVI